MKLLGIGSGKGGVGKSSIAFNLAVLLATSGVDTGLLDADVAGPSQGLLGNALRSRPRASWELAHRDADRARIEPVERYGVKIASSAYIVGEGQALAWDGGLVRLLLHQFIEQVEWGDTQLLVVDLPPGTGTEVQTFLTTLRLDGLVLVTTPQRLAHQDTVRMLSLSESLQIDVLGAVENMAGVACPNCDHEIVLFPDANADHDLWGRVERLARLPFEPTLALAGDTGRPFALREPGHEITARLRDVISAVRRDLGLD